MNDELTRHVKFLLDNQQRGLLKADMEKVKQRRRDREKNKLNAKLLQHETSKRINRGEDSKVVYADLKRKMEEQEEQTEKAEVKA